MMVSEYLTTFQADTFKNWINVNLKEVGYSVENLETDFQVRSSSVRKRNQSKKVLFDVCFWRKKTKTLIASLAFKMLPP
jgi:hypothetical protein